MYLNINKPAKLRIGSQKGFSLIEVMCAVFIIIIIALGTLCYQYLSIEHDRSSQAQIMGARIGQLLLEDWKSTGGDPDYDPASLQLGFETPNHDEFGNYTISLGNVPFYIQLQFNDVDQDNDAGILLRQIAVTVKWRSNYTRGAIRGADPVITLNTYVRRDQG